MKSPQTAVSLIVVFIAAGLLTGCMNPLSASKDGALSIRIADDINARTLLPAVDMTAAGYTVSGSGPRGASFSKNVGGGSATVEHLALGTWTVTVDALNAAGTRIGSGTATTTIRSAQTAELAITVVPLDGTGTLSLDVRWTAAQVANPSIQASLVTPTGPPIELSFDVAGGAATYSSSTIPAGYSTLTLQLLDGDTPVMGAVEVARIVAGQTTTGSFAFTDVNRPGGSIQVNITPALADPIPVSIAGVPTTLPQGQSATATASLDAANVICVWYLNGASVGTGTSFALGDATPPGYYRLDLTAFSADGTRGGSATSSFQITATGSGGVPRGSVANPTRYRLADYDIGPGGAIYWATYESVDAATTNLYLTVTSPSGSMIVPTARVASVANLEASDGSVCQISVSPGTGAALISWMADQVSPDAGASYPASRFFSSVLVSSTGGILAGPFAWPAAASGSYLYDAAFDDTGNFAVVYTQTVGGAVYLYLAFYDSSGNLARSPVNASGSPLAGADFGIHVALNPSDGSGFVTAQGHYNSPIQYRRFNAAHQFIDASLVTVPLSADNNSSWYESHIVGVNRSGDFIVAWQNYNARTLEADFFQSDGRLISHAVVSRYADGMWDGYRFRHAVASTIAGDFLIPVPSTYGLASLTPPSDGLHRFDSRGNRIGSLQSVNYGMGVRSNFDSTLFIYNGTTNAIDVSVPYP